ncbi:MAG: glycosyltransferase family 2 protein [Robiginitomaculum sp.]|nr:glycosyltransferase family 2 protein [Robiginitomaculum sp.]
MTDRLIEMQFTDNKTSKGNFLSVPISIDVIIVNYNAGEMLQRSVQCLLAQTFTNFRVFIVDNASTDDSLSLLVTDDHRIELLKLTENTGFARGNNIGATMGTAPWIACLNPDAFAEPNWLEKLLKGVTSDPDYVMAGSTQICATQGHLLDGAGDLYSPSGFAWRGLYRHPLSSLPPTGEVFGPCAAAALYRRDTFEAIGGFDESFFCYHEDVDLAFRLRLLGGKAIQVKEAIVHHVGSGITGTESPFAVYHGTRNRSWTFYKNMPIIPLLLLAPFHITLSSLFLIRAVFKKRFNPTWRGTIDSISGMKQVWKSRKEVQKNRTVSSLNVLKAMTWSLRKFLTRSSDVRPVKPKN